MKEGEETDSKNTTERTVNKELLMIWKEELIAAGEFDYRDI